MAKRKKHPRLPSGFGSIRYLGKGRSAPYAVHPPAVERDEHGMYVRPKALCYAPDWYAGFAALSAWHAGTYEPGMELKVDISTDVDMFCKQVLRNLALAGTGIKDEGPTFREVYDLWYDWKFGEHAAKKLSDHAKASMKTALYLTSTLHDRPFASLTLQDLQDVVNSYQDKSESTIRNIVTLYHGMYGYAVPRELCEKDLSKYVVKPSVKAIEHHEPFTDGDLKVLWAHRQDEMVKRILVMCYSGFRVSAFETLEVNTTDWYFKGGVKTAAGKDRIVPIHSGIQQFVPDVMDDFFMGLTKEAFRRRMTACLTQIGLKPLTPHSCRHTFSRLCETYGVAEADRKRMMGHSFGSDITNGVYGHRTLEELRAEIEKIKIL